MKLNPVQLGDWVEERLLRGPTPQGQRRGKPPVWHWDQRDYARALRICRLRAQGVKRHSLLRALLWLEGRSIAKSKRDQQDEYERLRQDLTKEVSRLRRRLFQNVSSTLYPGGSEPLPPSEQTTLIAQIGPLDSRLEDVVGRLPEAVWAESYGLIRFASLFTEASHGKRRGRDAQRVETLRPLLRGVTAALGVSYQVPDEVLATLVDIFSGLAADPTEVDVDQAAEDVVKNGTAADFLRARVCLEQTPWLSMHPPFLINIFVDNNPQDKNSELPKLLARVISQPDFRIFYYALLMMALRRAGENAPWLKGRALEAVIALRELFARQKATQKSCPSSPRENILNAMRLVLGSEAGLSLEQRALRRKLRRSLWDHGLRSLLRSLRPRTKNPLKGCHAV